MSKKNYTSKEIEVIMAKNKIIPYNIATVEQYNELGEEADRLKDKFDIISSLWFATITDSLYEFEFKNQEMFNFDEEDDKDFFYLGKKVSFNYKYSKKLNG